MEKYIPYEKLSKKEKRKLDSARRSIWGALSPVTRKPVSSRAYNRRKAQRWEKDAPSAVPVFCRSMLRACATNSEAQPYRLADCKGSCKS